MAANYRAPSSAPGFGQLFDLVVRHSQGGPYVMLVHALPDLVVAGVRRLQMLLRTRESAARSRNQRPSASHRAA